MIAKDNGKQIGRPQMNLDALSKEQKAVLEANYTKWQNKGITAVQLMDMLELKKNSFYKIVKEYEQ